jgi:ubiquinone/menaquinone biosynthesis C-methylase UbiE
MVDRDKREIKEFYDSLARKHWSRVPQRYGKGTLNTFCDLREKSIAQRLVAVKPRALTLDLCSGPGRWVLEYGERGAQIIALDISHEVLRSSKEKLKSVPILKGNAQFIVADAESLPFVDGVFDIVNCFDAFPHFPNQGQALREMKRVAKPNATIIVEPSNICSLVGIGIYLIRFLGRLLRRINVKVPIWATAWNTYDSPLASKYLIESVGLHITHMSAVLAIPPFSDATLVLFCKIEEKLENHYWFNLLGSRIVFICKNLGEVVEKTERLYQTIGGG